MIRMTIVIQDTMETELHMEGLSNGSQQSAYAAACGRLVEQGMIKTMVLAGMTEAGAEAEIQDVVNRLEEEGVDQYVMREIPEAMLGQAFTVPPAQSPAQHNRLAGMACPKCGEEMVQTAAGQERSWLCTMCGGFLPR